jgi:alcohol dehydrogenase
MPLRFKAAVLRQPGLERPYTESQPLQIEEVEALDLQDGEVLVRIQAASLCRSDLAVVSGVRAWPLPIIPGHEASGIVEEVSASVQKIRPGNHVALAFQPACGSCPDCLEGHAHLCGPGLAANRSGGLLAGGVRLHQGEQDIHHHMGLSAFAEYAIVSQHSVVAIPESVPLEIGALFGCAVMCGAGTVLNTGHVEEGDSVAIVGVGGVGLSAILGAQLAGAEQIIAVDTDQSKLDYARDMGATDIILNSDDTGAEKVQDLTGGGTNFAFETAGTLGGFETAYKAARRGGTVVSVGIVDPKTPMSLDIAGLVTGAKTIKGSYMGSCNPALDIPRFMSLYEAGEFPIEKLISHRLPLKDINLAMDQLADGDARRQILTP